MFDILLHSGTVLDGTGNPGCRADVAIAAGRIAAVGDLTGATARKRLDVSGRMVCPGFIDVHSHNDYAVPFDPRVESTIRQGITTGVIGNCGISLAPIHPERVELIRNLTNAFVAEPGLDITWRSFGEYLTALDRFGAAANLVPLVGFANLRIAGGPGFEDRPPEPDEMQAMKAGAREAMESGAFGMSTGLIFTPQSYATTAEVVEVAAVVAAHGGLYFTHIRGEGPTVVQAVAEAIQILETSGCVGGQIAHHKIAGRSYWGASVETLDLIARANARGLDVTCDQYPYTRGLGPLTALLPAWSHEGGTAGLVARLRNPDDRKRIETEVTEGTAGRETYVGDVGWDEVYLASVKTEKWKPMEGKSIAEMAQLAGDSDVWATIFDLLIDEHGDVAATFECMGDDDIHRIMTDRYTMFATDGWGAAPTGPLSEGVPHPRFYGTYPRLLGHYVREQGRLTLEDAVRRMTSFPAQRLGLFDRGLLRAGMWADLVVFDPDTVIDRATYQDPHQFSEGIEHVLVNGRIVVEHDVQNDALPGRVLRRPGAHESAH